LQTPLEKAFSEGNILFAILAGKKAMRGGHTWTTPNIRDVNNTGNPRSFFRNHLQFRDDIKSIARAGISVDLYHGKKDAYPSSHRIDLAYIFQYSYIISISSPKPTYFKRVQTPL
jgi:hypothetical protein